MSEKKTLNTEQLNKVNGGAGGQTRIYVQGDLSKYSNYCIPVDKYCGKNGEKYLFKQFGCDHWLFGKLHNTYESGLGFTKRIHDIILEDGYGYNATLDNPRCINVNSGGTIEIHGDDFQIYSNK